jgi:pseudouridine synthase
MYHRGIVRDPDEKRRGQPDERRLKTLERVFSKAGQGSRSDARSSIHAGRVRVNGAVIRNPDHWVDLDRDRVTVDGRPLRAAAPLYLLLYKPRGYVTTRRDPDGRPTVYDLLAAADGWLAPVGRLDLDTSGLLLMTNDTAFADHVASPSHKVTKTYELKAGNLLDDAAIDCLRAGVALSDGPTRPALVRRLRDTGKYTFLEIVIGEGRNRQVRRMVEAVGAKVLKLVRTAIGPIRIGDLPIGTWRALTEDEIASLGYRRRATPNTSARPQTPRRASRGRKTPGGAKS